jgi:hypothetical protein
MWIPEQLAGGLLIQSELPDLRFERSWNIWGGIHRLSPVRISAFARRRRDSEWFGHGLSVIFGGFSHGPRSALAGVLFEG